MNNKEFAAIRHRLGKTQKEMARLFSVSLKAIKSFEQGWRNVPVYIERQALLLLSLKEGAEKKRPPCWKVKKCSEKLRRNCPAWEFQAGDMCWFINGTLCTGKPMDSWHEKMSVCRKCEVFNAMAPDVYEPGETE